MDFLGTQHATYSVGNHSHEGSLSMRRSVVLNNLRRFTVLSQEVPDIICLHSLIAHLPALRLLRPFVLEPPFECFHYGKLRLTSICVINVMNSSSLQF